MNLITSLLKMQSQRFTNMRRINFYYYLGMNLMKLNKEKLILHQSRINWNLMKLNKEKLILDQSKIDCCTKCACKQRSTIPMGHTQIIVSVHKKDHGSQNETRK